jgi:nucleoside-diphosphate-sugar epimerase
VILVTGATGFIGSYVVRALRRRGHEVLSVSRYDYRPEALRVIGAEPPAVVRPDLRDLDETTALLTSLRPRAVIHLDAYVNPVALRADPLRAVEFNVRPTLNLLEAARHAGVSRLVLASSVAVLPTIREQPITADHPIVTAQEGSAGGFYGVSKAVSEVLALGYADAFELDTRIVRPSAVYGYGMQWPVGIKPVVEGLVDGEAVLVPSRAPLRDFTPVEDVAEIFAALVDAPEGSDRVVYGGTGGALVDPAGLLASVREVFPEGDIGFSDEDLDPTGVESRYRGVLDMRPVREQLGVQPRFGSLAEGLAHYADEYRAARADGIGAPGSAPQAGR